MHPRLAEKSRMDFAVTCKAVCTGQPEFNRYGHILCSLPLRVAALGIALFLGLGRTRAVQFHYFAVELLGDVLALFAHQIEERARHD